MLRYKTPSYPDRFRVRGRQRSFQPSIIHVTALGLLGADVEHLSGAETHCFISFADKHGMAVGFGKEGDRAQGGGVLLIDLAGRMNESHGGLATIHDRYASKFVVHIVSDRKIVTSSSRADQAARVSSDITARSAFNCSALTTLGLATVR